MRITVIGATGGIGTEVTGQALAAGHEVVAPVRNPARIALAEPALTVLPADVLNPEQLLPAVEGADAVVSALGPRSGDHDEVLTPGVRSAMTAMAKAGVRRLVIVSADGAYIDKGDDALARLMLKPIVKRVFREHYRDVEQMETLVRASDLDWTIVRPTRLVDRPYTGRYRTAVDVSVGRAFSIARADVAHAILTALGDPGTVRHMLSIAY
jgi:putative NADH-flavin reductase